MQKKIIFELIMSTQDVLTYSSLKTIFSSLKSIILIKWIFFLCKFNHLRTMLYIISIWSRFLPITETCFWNLSVSFDFRIFYISSEREESHKKKSYLEEVAITFTHTQKSTITTSSITRTSPLDTFFNSDRHRFIF